MPADGKVCTFDCIYCECGFNADHRPRLKRPSREEVSAALETKLKAMETDGRLPDVLTFAGNGEPTAHPQFAEIIDDTIRLRDTYCPEAKVSVLSNATQAMRPEVHKALERVRQGEQTDLPHLRRARNNRDNPLVQRARHRADDVHARHD